MITRFLLPVLLMTNLPAAAQAPSPPDVARKPHVVEAPFGATRDDAYYWLRDDSRKDKDMLAYLDAENAYADAVMAPLKLVQDALYGEIVSRIKQDDSSVPYRERGYWYYTRFETGKDYPIHARRKGTMDAPEEILFDVNAMAAGKDYFSLAEYDVSPDNRIVAWTRTKSAAASTACTSGTWRPARSIPTRCMAWRGTPRGRTTTARSSTSRTIPRRC